MFNDPQLFDDPQLLDDQLEVWTSIIQKSTVIPPSPMVLFFGGFLNLDYDYICSETLKISDSDIRFKIQNIKYDIQKSKSKVQNTY